MNIESIGDDLEEYDEENIESEIEPECTASPEEIKSVGVECEYEKKDGGWWCTTHNCPA